MSDLQDYQQSTTNYRAILRHNTHRTYLVMISFVLIYLGLGLLFDLYLCSEHNPNVPLAVIFHALITFQAIPYAALITTGIAIIALWVTLIFHNQLMLLGTEYTEITEENPDIALKQLYHVVEEMKIAAGLNFMPKVYVIDANYMNAFASGYSEKSAMIAITRGLLEKLDRAELTAVVAHELSHIRHLDIKLTLMASVLSNLMLMMIDALFFTLIFSDNRRSDEREGNGGNILFIVIMVLRYVRPLVTVLLTLYLSRTREYMADAGCVELMRDNEPLARALLKIQADQTSNETEYDAAYQTTAHESVRRAAYIFEPESNAFSTHPSISDRLKALGFKKSS